MWYKIDERNLHPSLLDELVGLSSVVALSHPVGGTGTPHRPFWVVIARLHKEGEKPLTLVRGVS